MWRPATGFRTLFDNLLENEAEYLRSSRPARFWPNAHFIGVIHFCGKFAQKGVAALFSNNAINGLGAQGRVSTG